jgi:type I restriction enzyme S subunit
MLLDIRPDHLQMVRDILQKHVPRYEVWAFGSRAKWTAKDYSDLDLCVVSDKPLNFSVLGAIAEDFSDSDLPWKVDVVDWATTSESFRKIIKRDKVVVQEAKSGGGVAGEWRTYPLAELTINHDGKRRPVKESDRRSGPYPYYGASGIVDYVDGFLIDGDFLLVAEDGENLRTRQTPIAFMARGKSWVNNHAHIVTGNDKADTLFLMYALQAADVNGYLTGAVMPKLTQGNLNKIKISCPSLDEQRAIAHILGTLDDKIELNRRMNETLEAIARAMFKSWFVDFDPVRAKAGGEPPASICQRLGLTPEFLALFPDRLVESELGDGATSLTTGIPEGWEMTTLQRMTTKIGSGATPRGGSEVYLDEGVALIRSQNVYDSNFVWEGLARISDEAAKQLAGVEVKAGDVLINITGASILRTCAVEPEVLPARVNQHVAIIRAKPEVSSRYVHLHLLQESTKAYLMSLNAGGSREAVTKGHLESVPILNPGSELLALFQKIVAPMYAEIEQLSSQSRVQIALRDTLLPKLLSGELRVNDGVSINTRKGMAYG